MITNDQISAYVNSLLDLCPDGTDGFYFDLVEKGHPVIRRDVAKFLTQIIMLKQPDKVLEIGTNVGYSAIIMAKHLKNGRIYSIDYRTDNHEMALNNFIKFGVVLIIVRLALTRNIGSLTDSTWLKQTSIILGGFALYDIVVAKIVEKINIPLNANYVVVINDVIKFGTMFATLKWFSDGNLKDPEWLKEVGAALAGLAIYHFISQNVIKFSVNF